jgi:acetyl-CoA acetyltransferase
MAKFDTAIAGVGFTEYSLDSGRSILALAVEACPKAMADAGLQPKDVDGMFSWATRSHGDVLLVWGCQSQLRRRLVLRRKPPRPIAASMVGQRRQGGSHLPGENGHWLPVGWRGCLPSQIGRPDRVPYGWLTFGQNMALWCRRHMEKYGTKQEHLAAIAISQREAALLNERAIQRKPMTLQDYMASRVIAEPFHLFDMSLETDGACALLVTSAPRARNCRKKPVYVRSAGHFGKATVADPMWADAFLWPDLTENYTRFLAPRLYEEAGLKPEDVDVAEIYDCFTYTVLMALEGLGFCKKGERTLLLPAPPDSRGRYR